MFPADILPVIRERPAMFIGDREMWGLTRLPEILIKAAALAAMEGRGDEVDVRLEQEGGCTFTFNGTLWPSSLVTEPPADSLTRLLTLAPHDRIRSRGEANPHYLSCFSAFGDFLLINGLSSWLEVTHRSEGGAWRQRFQEGVPEGPPHAIPARDVDALPPRCTRIRFLPDRAIFGDARFSRPILSRKMSELAPLTASVRYRLYDARERRPHQYRMERGLLGYTLRITACVAPLHTPWLFQGQYGDTQVQLVLRWSRRRQHRLYSWANLHMTCEGGMHLRGLRDGLRLAFQHVRPHHGPVPPLRGLTAVMRILHPSPVWEGSSKTKLGNPECRDAVRELVREWLIPRLEAEPELLEQILARQSAAREPLG